MRWLLAWIPLVFLMIGNGVVREIGYGPRMSELHAHQLSTVIGALIVSLYTWLVFAWLDVKAMRDAWMAGILWLLLTIGFEFGFGHYVAGHSWNRLLHDYNLFAGRIWLLFLMWLAAAPWVVFRLKAWRASA